MNLLAGLIFFLTFILPSNRHEIIRTSRFQYLRQLYKTYSIYMFLFNLSQVPLSPVIDDLEELPGGYKLVDEILSDGPDTYQKKSSNVKQIVSLLSTGE
ncbi:hypothetical protein TL16_g02747 [Triparma laevis f. inornata]|uniref:Uncharacterized protein n=1 Tax=Triparma laevis f. inornata TaxID=1714386 RepID=A0A9W6ZVB3_9STRA|nr:hypothetical protein TL16_g02747 [Triparma laevis f. inornata]